MAEAEEYEAILRMIMLLKERIEAREDTIKYFETVQALRREETDLPHRELMVIDKDYRHTFYSIRSLKGWQTRNRRQIEELEKVIPPVRALRIILTFSIETGEGHEPFYAEVTCDTVIDVTLSLDEQRIIIDRIMNAIIKLFWILFDIQKALLDLAHLKGTDDYDYMVKRKMQFQKYFTTIYEYAMDNLINKIVKLGGLERPKEEYVTTQAILKIGIEYHYAIETSEPKHPLIDVLIEKGTSAEHKADWVIERKVLIADETDVDMLRLLGMRYERKEAGKAG